MSLSGKGKGVLCERAIAERLRARRHDRLGHLFTDRRPRHLVVAAADFNWERTNATLMLTNLII